jgi:hypothetical protein
VCQHVSGGAEKELSRETEVYPRAVKQIQAEEGDLGAEEEVRAAERDLGAKVEVHQARIDSVFTVSQNLGWNFFPYTH